VVVTLFVTARAVFYPRTPAAIRVGTLVAVLVSIAWMFRQIV